MVFHFLPLGRLCLWLFLVPALLAGHFAISIRVRGGQTSFLGGPTRRHIYVLLRTKGYSLWGGLVGLWRPRPADDVQGPRWIRMVGTELNKLLADVRERLRVVNFIPFLLREIFQGLLGVVQYPTFFLVAS